MQAAKKETVFEFPDGGIADFYMTDDQFAELERRETVGHGGIANVHNIADRIAEYGRYGDDTLAHVETGELVVPKALLEKNPALKASIFEHLEELGVEDPERYIVGSGVNSLNPDTQLPEFFLGKLFKKARKVFKKPPASNKSPTSSMFATPSEGTFCMFNTGFLWSSITRSKFRAS